MATADPRCPHCDGPISGTSSYCMHCGEDVESPSGSVADDADVSDADDYVRTGGRPNTSTTTTGGWLDPDGLLDDASTVVVAGVAAVVVGIISFVVVLLVLQSLVAVLAGPLAAVAVGLWVGRDRSVFGAARKACYAIATALVLVPTIALGPSMNGGTFGGQVLLFVLAEVVFGLVALMVAGVGFAAGKRRPTSARGG